MSLGMFGEPAASTALTHTIMRSDLVVTITEQGLVESAENHEVKSKVRGWNTVLWIIDSGTFVEKGDELVRLNSSVIQEQIDERTKYSNWSQSAADRSAASVARAKLAVSEYEQGRYIATEMTLEKDVVVAEAALRSAIDRLRHTRSMARSEYVSELEVEEKEFAVRQARLNVELKRTQLEVLTTFTRKEQMQTLSGNFKSIKATHRANAERAMADTSRRDRAVDEIQHCVVVADRSGLVIHPDAAKWESGPIAEGTNVHKDQVLLLMPDLSKMQVKVGVHEAAVKRVKVDSTARVTLADGALEGRVSEVASITKPAGWWTANEVRYDTLITLPPIDGLRPGMSAEVEIVIAEHHNVLTIPVAAIVENDGKHHCWLKTGSEIKRRSIKLGDSNDVFTIVEEGLQEGDEVLLNPTFYEDTTSGDTNTEDQEPDSERSDATEEDTR
jgi:HlyD family secretion protein